jgi:hypothetical protein
MEGVEGFKLCGSNAKMEIKLPTRSEDFFLAYDIFDDRLNKKKSEDFSFMKKNKVKFNCVDVTVTEY